tara:strand:+ start:1326 stop:1958 length:633 start_codon:yes stop_codon:yes gene_type:complete
MADCDIPVIVSNVRANLRPGKILTKQRTISFRQSNVHSVLATDTAVFVKWKSAFVCNPRNKKPLKCLVLRTSDVDAVLSIFPVDYDTRQWSSNPFKSWGYDTRLHFSDPDEGVVAIEQAKSFEIVPLSSISSVEFARAVPGTRSFDVIIHDETGAEHAVEYIDKSELPRLHSKLSGFGEASDTSSQSSASECSAWEEGCVTEDDDSDCVD